MKYDHTNSYVYILVGEKFEVEYDFTDILASGDSIASAVVTMTNSAGTSVASTMISGESVSSPYVYFTIGDTVADETYDIKITATSAAAKIYVGKITCESFGSTTLNANVADPNANSYVTITEANKYIRNVRGHNSIWDTLSIEGKKRLLIEAAKDIDRYNFIGSKYYDFQPMQFPRDDHDTFIGDVATPITVNSFKNTSFTSNTYGNTRSYVDYWKYGAIHITNATPLYDVRQIESSSVVTDIVTVTPDFSATPTTNTDFTAFEPINKFIKDAQCEQALFILDNTNIDSIKAYGDYASEVEIGDVRVEFKDQSTSSSRPSIATNARVLLSKWRNKNYRVYRA